MNTCSGRPRIDAGDHVRLARRVVAEFLRRFPEHRYLSEDLLAAAQLGLAEAAARHDGRDETWGTYAYRYARGYMLITFRALAYPTRPARVDGELVRPRRVGLSDPARGSEEHGPSYEDIIPCEAMGAEEAAMAGDVAVEVEEFLAVLSPREADVIKRRFGIGSSARTLAQVGRELGVTKQWIQQLENRALARLRREARRRSDR